MFGNYELCVKEPFDAEGKVLSRVDGEGYEIPPPYLSGGIN